jgi:hypothetical protein
MIYFCNAEHSQYELDTTMHKQTQITNNTSNGAISISIFRKIETVNAEHLTDIIYFHILHHATRIFLFHIHAHEGSFYFLSIPPKVKYQDMMFVGLTVSIFLNIEIEIASFNQYPVRLERTFENIVNPKR